LSYGGLCVIKLSPLDPYDSNIGKLFYYYKAQLETLLAFEILDDMSRNALAWDMTYTLLTSLAGYQPAMNNGMIYFECAQLWESSGNFCLAVAYYRFTLKTLLKVGTLPAYFNHVCTTLPMCYHKQGIHFETLTTSEQLELLWLPVGKKSLICVCDYTLKVIGQHLQDISVLDSSNIHAIGTL